MNCLNTISFKLISRFSNFFYHKKRKTFYAHNSREDNNREEEQRLLLFSVKKNNRKNFINKYNHKQRSQCTQSVT